MDQMSTPRPRAANILRALFDHNSAVVALAGAKSEPFALQSGVLQGSLLSPLLYSIFIDDISGRYRAGRAYLEADSVTTYLGCTFAEQGID